MQRTLLGVVGACVLSALVGCGAASSENTGSVRLQATVARTDRALDNARAVAIASDGNKYWAYLDASGNFKLSLPAGKSYRVLIVNAQRSGVGRVAGHVVIATAGGTSRWIGLDAAGSTIDLGNLRLVASSTGSLTTQSDGETSASSDTSSRSTDEHADDPETHSEAEDEEGEHEDACTDHDGEDDVDETSDDDDVELHPTKEPGERCKDHHQKDHQDADGREKDDEHDKACAASGAASSSSGGTTTTASSSGGASSTTTSGGATSGGGAPAPAAAPVGTGAVGSVCAMNADCSAGLMCAASTCAVAVR